MSEDYIKYSIENNIAKIILNRPDVLNSFNQQMFVQLLDAFDDATSNKQVRVVYITGEGRAFCAGQDLTEALIKEDEKPKDLGEFVNKGYNPMVRSIRNIEKPVVCAVNGIAAGAGASMAILSDITLASKEASFIQSFTQIGLIPDSGATIFLPKLVGLQKATAMMMLGHKIKAPEALELGLVYKICEPEKLEEETMEIAKKLAVMPTKALGLTKRLLNQGLSNDIESQLALEEELQREAGYTYDYNEGVKAFIEKRKPVFRGE